MIRLTVISFGKLKTPGTALTCAHYAKMLSTFCEFTEIELKPHPVAEKSPAIRKTAQEKEESLLLATLKKIGGTPWICLLDERGKNFPTEAWAQQIARRCTDGKQHFIFCIGSSMGFNLSLRTALNKNPSALWSLGPQTISHQLAKVVLLEQLYRALSIINGHPYHHAD